MKKILYAASSYGHILSFHIPYIKQLEEMGFIVHAAAAGASDNEEPQGTKKINIPFEKSMMSFKNISCTFQLMKLIKKEKYDIISVHTSLAAFFVRLAVMLTHGKKPKVINTVHGYLFDENSPFPKRSILLWAEKFTKPVTDIVVVMNRQDYEIAEKYHLYKDKLIQIPGFGIDIKRFSRTRVEEKICREPNGLMQDGQKTCRKQSTVELVGQKIQQEQDEEKQSGLKLRPKKSVEKLRTGSEEYRTDILHQTRGHRSEIIRQHERDKLGIKTEDIILIYAAEFSKRKNQKMLIEAMAKLPSNVKLILAGKGEMLKECQRLAESLQLGFSNDSNCTGTDSRVLFLGHVKNLEIFYYLSDICVSASRSEGLPFNIMEAMAMGLPIVATDVKGHQDLVKQGINGYLYKFDNQQGFIETVLQLINDEKYISKEHNRQMAIRKNYFKISQNNRMEARKYGLGRVMEKVVCVYEVL